MFGLIYYMDFYNKGVENTSQEYGIIQPEDNMPIKNNVQEFNKAKQLIEEGMAKWNDLDYITYSINGRDGDEAAYFYEHYSFNFVEDEYSISIDQWCTSSAYECYDGEGYIKKGGNIIKYSESSETKVSSYSPHFSLNDFKDSIMGHLGEKGDYYDVRTNITNGVSDEFKNIPVTYIDMDFFRKNPNSAWERILKSYADVTFDKFSLEATIDEEGNILYLKIPYGYSEIEIKFDDINIPTEITLP